MKITVSTSSGTLASFLSAADLQRTKDYIASETPVTVSFLSNETGKTLYVETLSKTATSTEGRPVVYQDKLALTLEYPKCLTTIKLIASTSMDVRVLINALVLSKE